jgi:hypothetical protein
MTNTSAHTYKTFGDTTLAVFQAEFERLESPMLADAQATFEAARPHSALFLAQSFMENQYETTGHIIKPHHHNPVTLRPWPEDPRGMPPGATGTVTAPGGAGQFLAFATDADCVREWKRRLFDDPDYKHGVYLPATTLEQMVNIFAPPGDVHPITGEDNAHIRYAETVRKMLARFARIEVLEPDDHEPEPQTAFAKAIRFPKLDRFQDQPAASIPIAIEEGGRWWFRVGREARAIRATGRNQTPTNPSEAIGPEMMPGEALFVAWASVAANGRPFAYTNFGTIIWLDDTDMGIAT